MKDFEIRDKFDKLFRKMDIIDAKLSGLPQVQVQVSSRLLPTVAALQKLGSATATQVSQVTARSRAFESKNLNDLCTIGLVNKEKQGRLKIFKLVNASGDAGYILNSDSASFDSNSAN